MKYYEDKRRASNKLEKMILSQKEININVLYYDISKNFGYGRQFVDNFVTVLQAIGKITVKEDVIINKELK